AGLGGFGGSGRAAVPSLWPFQIGYQVLSPLIDLQVVLTLLRVGSTYFSTAIVTREWRPMPQAVEACAGIVTLFVFFFLLELAGALVAYRLDRERTPGPWWLFLQPLGHLPVMYLVR